MVTLNTLRAGAASLLQKVAATAVPPSSADLGLDMNSAGGVAADYLPLSWGRTRAGRASHLSKAMNNGEQPSFNVRNPSTSDVLARLGGAAAGGLGAAGISAGLNGTSRSSNPGMLLHTLLGAGGGALAGAIKARHSRRQSMKQIAEQYDGGKPADPSVRPDSIGLSEAALFAGSPHRAGQVDVYEALNNTDSGKPSQVSNGALRNIAYTAEPFAPVQMLPAGHAAQDIFSKYRTHQVDKKRKGDNVKAAAIRYGAALVVTK